MGGAAPREEVVIYPCEYCGRSTPHGPAQSARFEGLIWPACCRACEGADIWRPIHTDHVTAAARGFAAAATDETRRRAGIADDAFYHEIALRLRPPASGVH